MDQAPWVFRYRAAVIGISYALGFVVGYVIHAAIFGNVVPTFIVLGQRWGPLGIDVAASVGALLVVIAYCIRWWASSYHTQGVVFSHAVVTDHFTAAGPYRYTRNPLYFANILLALGVGFIGPPTVTVLLVAFNIFIAYKLAAIEEQRLLAEHGDAYRRYCGAVPTLFPRLTPPDYPKDETKPSFADGFRTELFSLVFVLVMLYFAAGVVLGLPLYYVGPAFAVAGITITILSFVVGEPAKPSNSE